MIIAALLPLRCSSENDTFYILRCRQHDRERGGMFPVSVFTARCLSDAQIWSRVQGILRRRDELHALLANPTSARTVDYAKWSRELHELEEVCVLAERLRRCLADLQDLDDLLAAGEEHEIEELSVWRRECEEQCRKAGELLYAILLERGYIDEEREDGTDLTILRFIAYAGPEYAWRLSININIGLDEARERLEKLLEKGLLERVQGTMLDGYHREKDWTKHMNHTYYRLSREGRLYLRNLREDEPAPF